MRSRVEPLGGWRSLMRIDSVLHDPHEMSHLLNHAARDRRIRVLDHLVELAQPERFDGGPLSLGPADGRSDQLQAERARLSHWRCPRVAAPARRWRGLELTAVRWPAQP